MICLLMLYFAFVWLASKLFFLEEMVYLGYGENKRDVKLYTNRTS